MEKVSGVLESVASSTIHNNSTNTYNTFEIGGRMLQKVRAARAMDDMLRDALGDETTIWLVNKGIIGLKRSNGKAYVMKEIHRPGIASLILGIALLPLWGLGLVVLWARQKVKQEVRVRDQIRAELPNATVLEY